MEFAADYVQELRRATAVLPSGVRRWMARAFDSTWFQIEPGAYDAGHRGGHVCPFVAAAMLAGVWSRGEVLPGNPDWGSPDGPTAEIEDFAAYFDLCSEQIGTLAATDVIRDAIRGRLGAYEHGRARFAAS